MTLLFWLTLGLIGYVYAGYPLLLYLTCVFGGEKGISKDSISPTVSLIVSAFNEGDVISDKVRNCLALAYPRERLQIVVVSDASDDGTDEKVASFSDVGVELLRMPERGGKTAGLNAAMEHCWGEIVVFSDANALYERDAVSQLVKCFADIEVGAVVGESTYVQPGSSAPTNEGLYWRYELALKRLESRTGSLVGGDGAIYAVRRRLYVSLPADALSDYMNPLQVVKSGYRCVYEPAAKSFEEPADDDTKEFRRKVRIVNRAWRATMSMSEMLNPFRFGFFSIKMISHKLLRWSVPLMLVMALVVNALVLDKGRQYQVIFAVQCTCYALAIIGYVLRRSRSLPAPFAIPYYFVLVNIASAIGIIDALRGRKYTTWATVRARSA